MSGGIRSDDPYIARQWSSYLRRERSRRWWLMKRQSSILYVDLFPLLPLLRPLNFKRAHLRLCLSDRWHKTPRKWWYELRNVSEMEGDHKWMWLGGDYNRKHILAHMASHYVPTVIATVRKCWYKNTKHGLPLLMVPKLFVYTCICLCVCMCVCVRVQTRVQALYVFVWGFR